MSCLKGHMNDEPKPLYQRDEMGGHNMIGKARLVSASPYRATIKVHKSAEQLNRDSDSEDEF